MGQQITRIDDTHAVLRLTMVRGFGVQMTIAEALNVIKADLVRAGAWDDVAILYDLSSKHGLKFSSPNQALCAMTNGSFLYVAPAQGRSQKWDDDALVCKVDAGTGSGWYRDSSAKVIQLSGIAPSRSQKSESTAVIAGDGNIAQHQHVNHSTNVGPGAAGAPPLSERVKQNSNSTSVIAGDNNITQHQHVTNVYNIHHAPQEFASVAAAQSASSSGRSSPLQDGMYTGSRSGASYVVVFTSSSMMEVHRIRSGEETLSLSLKYTLESGGTLVATSALKSTSSTDRGVSSTSDGSAVSIFGCSFSATRAMRNRYYRPDDGDVGLVATLPSRTQLCGKLSMSQREDADVNLAYIPCSPPAAWP